MIAFRAFFLRFALAALILAALVSGPFLGPSAHAADANGGAESAEPPPPSLGLPLDCLLGRTCWVVNHFDHDPGPGVRDYMCGAHGYNGHTGVDFAIRDYSRMDDGVPVVAAAAGVVAHTRDGMLDGDIEQVGRDTVSGRECGNTVILDHPGGWQTVYCHLRRNSLVVHPGERVEKGQKLGLVGSSGLAQFPHVHLAVRRGRHYVDPFVGLSRRRQCGLGPEPLWDSRLTASLQADPTVLYDAGFAPVEINTNALRRGFYRKTELSERARYLIFWIDSYWVEAGDRLTLTITDPSGRVVRTHTTRLKKEQARYMAYVGKRRTVLWHRGFYKGVARLERDNEGGKPKVYEIERTVEIR